MSMKIVIGLSLLSILLMSQELISHLKDDSNVTKSIDTTDKNCVEAGIDESLEIDEENKVKDAHMKNTTIHQGLIIIKDGTTIRNLNITQKNTIQRSNIDEKNGIGSIQITQGQIKIKDKINQNITQNIENKIDNLTVNNSLFDQECIHANQSDIISRRKK